nr:GntR family transcriptional regulator [Mangrovicoccus ximenensis]
MLSERQLAEQTGVSRTPLRSALSRLEREGVISSPEPRPSGAPPWCGRRHDPVRPGAVPRGHQARRAPQGP